MSAQPQQQPNGGTQRQPNGNTDPQDGVQSNQGPQQPTGGTPQQRNGNTDPQDGVQLDGQPLNHTSKDDQRDQSPAPESTPSSFWKWGVAALGAIVAGVSIWLGLRSPSKEEPAKPARSA